MEHSFQVDNAETVKRSTMASIEIFFPALRLCSSLADSIQYEDMKSNNVPQLGLDFSILSKGNAMGLGTPLGNGAALKHCARYGRLNVFYLVAC